MSESFDAAVRRYFGAPETAVVNSEWEGSDNNGCDTCGHGASPMRIILTAHEYKRSSKTGRPIGRALNTWRATFTDLPDVWAALFPEEIT